MGRTATIVVDMQNDFCHPDGALYAEGSEAVIDAVNEVIDKASGPVFYTQDTHTEDSPEFEQWGEHCVNGTWGHEIHDDITAVYPSGIVQKNTYDAFHETELQDRLVGDSYERDVGGDVDSVIICGTLANVCVQETASSAALHGYDVTVVSDAVGYLSEEQRDAALDHIDFLIGDVVSVDDL